MSDDKWKSNQLREPFKDASLSDARPSAGKDGKETKTLPPSTPIGHSQGPRPPGGHAPTSSAWDARKAEKRKVEQSKDPPKVSKAFNGKSPP